MFFVFVPGLGFIRFLDVGIFGVRGDGKSSSLFFTQDVNQATRWNTKKELIEELNGEIPSSDFQVLKIEVV